MQLLILALCLKNIKIPIFSEKYGHAFPTLLKHGLILLNSKTIYTLFLYVFESIYIVQLVQSSISKTTLIYIFMIILFNKIITQ